MNINTITKVAVKIVVPVVSACMAFATEFENQKQKQLIADLVTRVTKLEKK